MKKGLKKSLALILGLAMIVGSLTACGDEAPASVSEEVASATTETSASTETVEAEANAEDDVLVVGYDQFASKFSPFFATLAYDVDVYSMTALTLLASDREGNVVLNGATGEVIPYNGTDYTYTGLADCVVTQNDDGSVVYDFKMREDVKFADGENVTADDVIFSMYVLADPTYDGASTFYALPIRGMEEFRSGMDTLFNLLYAAGKDNTDFTYWDEATQTAFWADLDQAAEKFVQEIKDYLVSLGYNTADDTIDLVMTNWGYEVAADASLSDVFYTMVADGYDGDVATASDTETAGSSVFDLMNDYSAYSVGVSTGDSAANISGIEKTGDYSVRVTMDSFDATAIYQMTLAVAPLHYYGDEALYDYDNNKFGFNKGDMSLIKVHTTEPMGDRKSVV